LHNGNHLYDGAVDCLNQLTKSGKKTIILSNSGRRSAENKIRLENIGFTRECYTDLITSGDVAWQMLASEQGLLGQFTGKRCLFLASDNSAEFSRGLPLIPVKTVEESDLIILAGIDDERPNDYYLELIEAGVNLGIPLVCTNPDSMRITHHGLKPSAGYIAKQYQNKGGTTYFVGKPYPEIYEYCFKLTNTHSLDRVVMIGDSLHHDVTGGNSVGIDTMLIMGGVHAAELLRDLEPKKIAANIANLARPSGALPEWACDTFKWQ